MAAIAPTTAPAPTSALPRVDFLYLSEPDMIAAGVTDMAACVDTMEETLALLYKGDYRMAGENGDSHGAMVLFPDEPEFAGMPKNGPDRRLMAMPAYLGGDFGTCGAKWYGSNADNRTKGLPRSILVFVLNDADTGAPLAFMSANLLSAYRTGAIPGVGARYFAPEGAETVGIVGPGVMAKTSLEAFIVARPGLKTLKVKGRGQASLENYCAWAAKTFPQLTTIEVVDTVEETVIGSDIVSYCTSVTGEDGDIPIVRREWAKPGAFFSMPASCDIDDGMIEADVRKIVDNRGLYEAWAEEYPYPTFRTLPLVGSKFTDLIHDGRMTLDQMEDLGGVVAGATPGRKSEDEVVILSVGGMPVEDVAWGTKVYRNAIARGIGAPLNLWETPALA